MELWTLSNLSSTILLTFQLDLILYRVAKKILMLILTDALGDQEAGIVCDIHLAHAFINLWWTDQTDTDQAANIGSEVQFWLLKKYWYRVNPGTNLSSIAPFLKASGVIDHSLFDLLFIDSQYLLVCDSYGR